MLATLSVAAFAEQPTWSWSSWCKFDDSIFPSYCISTATLRVEKPPDTWKGDANGVLGVKFVPVEKNTRVTVEISASKFIRKSEVRVTLATPGIRYTICPTLDYDFDALYAVREPEPITVSYKITDPKGVLLGQTKKRIMVRPINDCFTGIRGEPPHKEFYAAYVNENHPLVEKILQQALKENLVPSFSGYQKGPEGVRLQVAAIWKVLQGKGIKYSSITTESVQNSKILSQHVRFFDDSVENTQANCVDGSVLMASILRKIGLKPFLVIIPGHCFLGVYEDKAKAARFGIETTVIGSGATIEKAIQIGTEKLEKAKAKYDVTSGYYLVDIDDARKLGIQPLRSRKNSAQ